MAMMDGAEKYGPYNWRKISVRASIYIDAAKRHLDAWFEGQECASDSKVHHLGHALACCAILLDAQACGRLIDDRPLEYDHNGNIVKYDGWYETYLNDLSTLIKEKKTKNESQGSNQEGSQEGH